MNNLFEKCDYTLIKAKNSVRLNTFRKGDGGVFTMIIGAAIGALVLIGFYLVSKDGLSTWGDSFKELVKL